MPRVLVLERLLLVPHRLRVRNPENAIQKKEFVLLTSNPSELLVPITMLVLRKTVVTRRVFVPEF